MNFIVQVEGDSGKPFRTADAAIAYAKTRVYLSSTDQITVRNDLRNGQIAEWSYGFKGVQIIPREEDSRPMEFKSPNHEAVAQAAAELVQLLKSAQGAGREQVVDRAFAVLCERAALLAPQVLT